MRESFVYLLRETKEISFEAFSSLQEDLQEVHASWVEDLIYFTPMKRLEQAAEQTKLKKNNEHKYRGTLKAIRDRDIFPRAYLDAEVCSIYLI